MEGTERIMSCYDHARLSAFFFFFLQMFVEHAAKATATQKPAQMILLLEK